MSRRVLSRPEARAASHQCSIEALTREVEAERAEVALRPGGGGGQPAGAASEEAAAAYRREVDPLLRKPGSWSCSS